MHRPYNPLSLPFTQHSPNCRFLIIVIFMNRIWVWISIGKSLVCGENRSFAIESRLHWRIYIVAIICMFVLFCCYCCFVVLLHSHSLYSSIVPSTTIIPPPSISSLFISPYCVCVFAVYVSPSMCCYFSYFFCYFIFRSWLWLWQLSSNLFHWLKKRHIFCFLTQSPHTPQKWIHYSVFAKRNGNNILENGRCAHSACPTTNTWTIENKKMKLKRTHTHTIPNSRAWHFSYFWIIPNVSSYLICMVRMWNERKNFFVFLVILAVFISHWHWMKQYTLRQFVSI